MITVESWAEIRRLYEAEDMPIKSVVRRMGISRNTVCVALAADTPPTQDSQEEAAAGRGSPHKADESRWLIM